MLAMPAPTIGPFYPLHRPDAIIGQRPAVADRAKVLPATLRRRTKPVEGNCKIGAEPRLAQGWSYDMIRAVGSSLFDVGQSRTPSADRSRRRLCSITRAGRRGSAERLPTC